MNLLDANYEKLKKFMQNKQKHRLQSLLEADYKRAKEQGLKNFDKLAIRHFANHGYKLEDFDFNGDAALQQYAHKQLKRHKFYDWLLTFAIVGSLIGLFIITPIIISIIRSIQESAEKAQKEKVSACTSKLIHYSWSEENGCQKSNFTSQQDCFHTSYYKTYYYDEESYSYKKYHEYYVDHDIPEEYRKVQQLSFSNGPTDKTEFYITCDTNGAWHTNTVTKQTINTALEYWDSIADKLF